MAFFLNEEQEIALSEFLNRENKKICEKQINEVEIPKEFRDLIEKTMETGSPVPFFDPLIGYYTISFTPCEKGERIYIHHHLTGASEAIYDPSLVTVSVQDEEEEPTGEVNQEELTSVVFNEENPEDAEITPGEKISGITQNEEGIYFPS